MLLEILIWIKSLIIIQAIQYTEIKLKNENSLNKLNDKLNYNKSISIQ